MKCAECGTRTQKKLVLHTVSVGGLELVDEISAAECPKCERETIDLAQLGRFEFRVAAVLARHGVCTGESFKFIRKALGMRAADVGDVLGVTPETVSRWETGQREVDRHVFALLGELAIAKVEGRPSPSARFKLLTVPDRKLPAKIDLRCVPVPS